MTATTFVNDHAPSRSPWSAQTGSRYRVVCADGVVRTATATAEADTWFSVPARVQVRGRTVAGYVSAVEWFDIMTDDERPAARYLFRAYQYRKNAGIIVESTGDAS